MKPWVNSKTSSPLTMPFKIIEDEAFKRDFAKLGAGDIRTARKRLAFLTSLFQSNRQAFLQHTSRPFKPILSHGLTSTLYVLRVTPRLRAFITFDEDPLFETVTLNFLRIFSHQDYERDFRRAVEKFYRQQGINLEGKNHGSA